MKWLKSHKSETLTLIAILLVTAFLRFYKISEYMTFLGDEGRDAIVVKDIIVNHHFPLLGPPTSVGNMYLGPLYYYMMASAMFIFPLNPVAAAGMVALIGIAVVFLIYYLTKNWFGEKSAFIASFLYAISPINIYYSRSSWNPNPAPFFSLLSILGIVLARRKNDFRWLILSGGALAFDIQMHYLALIMIPVIGVLWLNELRELIKEKINKRHFLFGSILGLLIFLLLMSPLAIFDIHHNFMNWKAVTAFFGDRQTTVNLNIFNTLGKIWPIYSYNLIGRYMGGENLILSVIISVIIFANLIWAFYFGFRKKNLKWEYFALGSWLIIGVLGLSLYKQSIYDHYLGFLNPVPYILLGASLSSPLFKNFKSKIWTSLIIAIFAIASVLNLQKNPFLTPPNNELKRTQDIAKYIIERSGNKPFNFALLSSHNYDAAYQYYLDLYGHKPKVAPMNITDQLFVVCEDSICQPINSPKYEIAAFGWSKIEWEQDFEGIKLYKLLHNR